MRKSITLKNAAQIKLLFLANQIVAETLLMLQVKIKPGISTLQIDNWAESFAKRNKVRPAFKGYRGFPGSICVSINEQVVHGIPCRNTIVKEGDILSIDFGVYFNGVYGDAAMTVAVGALDKKKEKLLRITEESLYKGIEQARPGNRVNDISKAIQQHVEGNGFSVVKDYVGHGIGCDLHEPPEIPNYSRSEWTPRLLPGMVLAIEPMVNAGEHEVVLLKDGWTVVTKDNEPSAHFEHTVAITNNEPIILSQRLIG